MLEPIGLVPLADGGHAVVDAADVPFLSILRWHRHRSPSNPRSDYARAHLPGGGSVILSPSFTVTDSLGLVTITNFQLTGSAAPAPSDSDAEAASDRPQIEQIMPRVFNQAPLILALALGILAEVPETASIPVIALSANAMPSDIEKGLAAGFFRYLTKPIKVNEFMATLDSALLFANRQAARAGTLRGAR